MRKSCSRRNRWKFFFSRDLFADVMSVHHRNVKHAGAIEIYALCYKRIDLARGNTCLKQTLGRRENQHFKGLLHETCTKQTAY